MNFSSFDFLHVFRWSSICIFCWRSIWWVKEPSLLPLILLSIPCMYLFFVILGGYPSGASRLGWTLERWPCPPVSIIPDHRRLPLSTDSPESSQTSRRPLTIILVTIWKAVLCRKYSFVIWICGFVILNYVPRSGGQLITDPDPTYLEIFVVIAKSCRHKGSTVYHLKLKNIKLFLKFYWSDKYVVIARIQMRIQEANWLPYRWYLSTGSRSHDIADFKILVFADIVFPVFRCK